MYHLGYAFVSMSIETLAGPRFHGCSTCTTTDRRVHSSPNDDWYDAISRKLREIAVKQAGIHLEQLCNLPRPILPILSDDDRQKRAACPHPYPEESICKAHSRDLADVESPMLHREHRQEREEEKEGEEEGRQVLNSNWLSVNLRKPASLLAFRVICLRNRFAFFTFA